MPKAFSFAHLLGFGATKAAEEDEKDKKRDDETEEEYQDRIAESEDDDKKADDNKEKPEASDDDDADDEKDKDEDDKKTKKAVKAAVFGERARCAAIFSSPSAASRPDLAAHLAFNTDMTTSAAIDLLKVSAVNPAGKPGLAGRMSTVIVPNPGTTQEQAAATPTTTAAAIIAAGKKARGEA